MISALISGLLTVFLMAAASLAPDAPAPAAVTDAS
jgi:hypothetical protein